MDSSTNSDISWEFVYRSCSEFLHVATTTVFESTFLGGYENINESLKKLEALRKEIDQIIDRCEQPNLDDPFIISVRESIDEVKSLREKVIKHIVDYNNILYPYVEAAPPPSYEEVMSTSSSNNSDRQDDEESASHSLSYRELGNLLENVKGETQAQSAQLIYSCNDVTLYFISSSGNVSVSDNPDTVRIFEIEDGSRGSLPKYYLQIFIFVYPLVPRVSPCIRTEFGAILLPNVNVDRTERTDVQSIALLVPTEEEANFISCIENILQTKIVLCNTKNAESVSTKISDTINTGAECVAKFLIQSAEKAQEYMDETTPKLIDRIPPNTRQKRVRPCLSNGIKIARDVTGLTAGISSFVVSTVGSATSSLGQLLAPHIKEKGSKLISSTTGVNEKVANEKVDAVFNVTAGAIEGVGTVYQGLMQSARIFGRSLSGNTVQIVKHKYGEPAAEFTKDTFETVSNGVEIGTNLRFFKPTNLAKTAAKGVVLKPQQNNSNKISQKKITEEVEKCKDETISSNQSSQTSCNNILSQPTTSAQAQFTPSEILQPNVISQHQPVIANRAVQYSLAETQADVFQDLLL